MFARHVSMHLKPNARAEFTQTLEKEIIPLLRKQKGFQDEIAFVAAGGGTEVVAISLWDKKEDAEAYQRGSYPEVLKTLAKVVDGTPEVRNFEVTNSTLQKIAVAA
jgi:heme-degrading monooxygenase HmoA